MTTQSFEERLEALEKKNERLEYQVERNRAAIECTRLVNRFCYINNQSVKSKNAPLSDMFALKQPDVAVQHGTNVYEGAESVKKIYGRSEKASMPPGLMFLHPLASVYIEVARDLKTAKGVCMSIGLESGNTIDTAAWSWGAYGIDFINEGGEWKIWHFNIYRIFSAPYLKSWVAYDPDAGGPMPPSSPDEEKTKRRGPEPVKPTRQGKTDSPYKADREFIFKPDPPEPYETFDPSTSYTA